MYTQYITRHLRPRVKMVPMKKRADTGPQITHEQLIAALDTPASERTDQQIDTILLSIGQWKCFTNTIKSEQIRREVCRHAVLERHEANTVLFKEGDPPNGWYIIVTGECHVIKLAESDVGMHDMSIEMIKNLKEALGEDKYFVDVFTAGPKNDIGAVALITNKARNATIYVTQPSELVRVDSQVYTDTAVFFQKMQLQKRANLFSVVKEFQVIKEDPESAEKFSSLAENSTEYTIPQGTIIDIDHCEAITTAAPILKDAKEEEIAKVQEIQYQKTQSLYVIAEGKMILSRVVNFSKVMDKTKKNQNKVILSKAVEARKKIESELLKIKKPVGVHSVQVITLEPGCMFPDPRLEGDWVTYQFSLKVLEPAVVHGIRISDLYLALPLIILDKIKKQVQNQPSDEQVIEQWLEKQKQVQWNAYKQECVKEARRNVKVQKQVMNGDYGLRRAGIPKSMKQFVPQPLYKRGHSPSFAQDYSSTRMPRSPKRPTTSLY